MPFIRYTYEKDVRLHGTDPVLVSDVTAVVLVEKRRAELVDASAPVEPVTDAPVAESEPE